MVQKLITTHFSKKGHVTKIQKRVFSQKKTPLRERTHSLKACIYLLKRQELVLILQEQTLDLAKGES